MRPWASWTARTAVFSLAAGLAATAAGLPSVALAASGSATQTALAGDVCRDAGALLGIAGAACQSVTLVASPAPAPAQVGQPAAGTGRAAAGQGASQRASQGSGQGSGQGASQGSGLGFGRASGQGTSGQGTARTSARPPAARAGDTNVPAATQLAGLGALPGLADLPSAGPASTPARNGAPGGGIPMPGTALSAASSGVSSDSFAALAVGALLAGATALKIAGRRTRDRKAGIGVVAQ